MYERSETLLFSIIIPTLNAGPRLTRTLALFQGMDPAPEIIVTDGGSSDNTLSIAKNADAIIVTGPKGRGNQLRKGVLATSGDWLLFLHADTIIDDGWEQVVQTFMVNPENRMRAGYFDFALDDDSPAAKRLEEIVAWRCETHALPYGDQGLLISRELYDEVGGFKPLPLMEDIDIVRRLGWARLEPIGLKATTSAERYKKGGYLKRSLKNLFCLGLYYLGVSPKAIERVYR